ncbi:MAG TPA: GTPase [Bacteroidales bacterium]|nr:GTPase [Bacteroidales bacterium]
MKNRINIEEILRRLEKEGIKVEKETFDQFVNSIEAEIINYIPKIGIFGKTGVGKSSLCNALFGEDVAEVNDVEACTREPNEYILNIGAESSIKLIDMPGLGESVEKDHLYQKLYKNLLPKLDCLLWVVKADDRALSVDQHFHEKVLGNKAHKYPLVLALNQIDKIEPFREWNVETNCPSDSQWKNVTKKRDLIYETLNVSRRNIIPVSALEGYGLPNLTTRLIQILPDDKKYALYARMKLEFITNETKEEVKEAMVKTFLKKIGKFAWDHKAEIAISLAGIILGGKKLK